MSSTIFVVGAINGQLREAFKKIADTNSGNFGPLAFAVVVGDLFRDASSEGAVEQLDGLLAGNIEVAVPTYFSVGEHALPQKVIEKIENTGEVCPNLIFVGRKGTITTSEGIRLAVLGGRMTEEQSDQLNRFSPNFVLADARGMHGAHSADILITHEFPLGVLQGVGEGIPEDIRAVEGQRCISDLCTTLKPRYHFSTSPKSHFKRNAFAQPVEYDALDATPRVTFFESLAPFQNRSKMNKWHSAFKFDPKGAAPHVEGLQQSPFLDLTPPKRKRALDDQAPAYSRYENGESNGHRSQKRHRGVRTEGCFFCLSDPGLRQHLVAFLSEDAYLTVPRGPLPTVKTFPQLSFPGQVLIIPNGHAGDDQIALQRPMEDLEKEYAAMMAYRKQLYKMLQKKSGGGLGGVTWEANRSGVRHQHLQFCPAPVEMVEEGLVEAAFKLERENNSYPLFQTCNPDHLLEQKTDYFRLWLWTPAPKATDPVMLAEQIKNGETQNGSEKSIFFPLPSNQKFDIQFGRKTMAKVLKMEDRSDWRQTEQTEDQETNDKDTFVVDFEEFDPFAD